jgi:hypothetical protein
MITNLITLSDLLNEIDIKKSVLAALPLAIALAGCAPSHEVANPPQQQIPASHVSMDLPPPSKMAGRRPTGGKTTTMPNWII